MLTLALTLAQTTGYAVFPCTQRGDKKKPTTPNGFQDATSDPDEIAMLWRFWPGELVAIATGAKSGVSVLDIDRKHPAAVDWWRENHSRLLPTRAYATRSGGVHLYYQHEAGIRNKQGIRLSPGAKPCLGIDVRGEGGLAVFWGIHGCKCLDDTPPAPWPGWLKAVMANPAATPTPPKSAPPSEGSLAALVRAVASAQDGARNCTLFWAANRCVDAGRTDRDTCDALIEAAERAGLDKGEATGTVNSAMKRRAAA